jgi:hypothetical protein
MSTRQPIFSRFAQPAILFLLGFAAALHAADSSLDRIKYNNPGLAVDLGVGLWAWPVPYDVDGDGDLDLIVSCPDKPSNGIYVFENVTGDTAKNKMPVFKAGRRISKTATYVTPSYVDGGLRVLTPEREYPDFLKTGIENPLKLAVTTKSVHTVAVGNKPDAFKIRHNQWRYVDYDGDGKLDLTVAIEDWADYGWDNAWNAQGKWTNGPLHGIVYVLKNEGSTAQPRYAKPFLLEAGGKRLDTFGCPSPNFIDFDKDGDLDILCGEFLDGFTYFENIGTRTAPKYAAGIKLKTGDGQPLTMDLEMIVPVAFDWDKDGDYDLIVGDEDGRVAFIENTGKFQSDHTPIFLPPKYFQQEADEVKFGALATPVGFDWDGDGDTDILCGDTAGYIAFFENLSGPGVEQPKWAPPKRLEADGKVLRIMAGPNGSIQGPAEAKWGYTTQSVSDWDGDGLPDLIVNSILGKVVWYKNIGTRTKPKLAAAQPVEVEWNGAQPALAYGWLRPEGKGLLTQWRTTPVTLDFNQDGLMDLVMLDQEGYLAFFERKKQNGTLVLLPPQRILCDDKGAPLQLNAKIAGGSGRRKLTLVDWDGDGKLDILLNSQNAQWLRQTAQVDGKYRFENKGNVDVRNIEGHDTHPTAVDWNKDGIPDLLIGAEDGRLYYLRNPRSGK